MKDVGKFDISENRSLVRRRRTVKALALRLLEEVCNVVSAHTPRKDALGLSILSEMVAGETIRKICQTHDLSPVEASDYAEYALETIRETLSHPTWVEHEFPDYIDEKREDLTTVKSKLLDELWKVEDRAVEAEHKFDELEKNTIALLSDAKRRNTYMRKLSIERLPVSTELKIHAARCGFDKLGDVIDIHPYDLVIKHQFTPQLLDDLENYIKVAGLERKIRKQ